MIADSNTFRDNERVLPQHQAVLTLLQSRLSASDVSRLSWLDLACGRGQIILNLPKGARAKIEYWAYDLNQEFARETRRTAEDLGFHSFVVTVGNLSKFDSILPSEMLFDFITLTNTIYEIEPVQLASLLVSCLKRLTDTGTLFIYDTEKTNPPELGAIPWCQDDIRYIVRRMLDALEASNYHPEVGLWNHSTGNGWNVQLDRSHLGISRDDATERIGKAIQQTSDEISQLLKRKLLNCWTSLEALTYCGAGTTDEQNEKEHLLFEFWALSRAFGFSK